MKWMFCVRAVLMMFLAVLGFFGFFWVAGVVLNVAATMRPPASDGPLFTILWVAFSIVATCIMLGFYVCALLWVYGQIARGTKESIPKKPRVLR
jgi:hypothetical protein